MKKYHLSNLSFLVYLPIKSSYIKYIFSLCISLHLVLIGFILPYNLRAQSSLQKLDDSILINLQNNRTPRQTGLFLFLSKTVNYGNVGVPAGLLIGGIASHNKLMRQDALYVASSTATTFLFTSLLKFIVKRQRPFVNNLTIVPVYKASNYSFPSAHTSTSFSSAMALSMSYPKWYVIAPSFIWAAAVGYSRLYLGVHYPTDISGGVFVGAGTASSLIFIKHN